MALPSSGPLSMNDIAGEFGGSTPHALNEYYAGGGLVPAGTSGTYGAVPSSGTISIQNFYGTSNFVPIYIEEVFQTWLYTGNNSTNTITNGVNLSGSGGLVWMKGRGAFAENHNFIDTARGVTKSISSNNSDAELTNSGAFSSFNTNGFTLGPVNAIEINSNTRPYVSWTFRKQPKFFDIVTYTGDGTDNRQISHSLGSVPGCFILKATNLSTGTVAGWFVYHRSLTAPAYDRCLFLNTTDQQQLASWLGAAPTSTTVTLKPTGGSFSNTSGVSYVMYLFAHDAGGFGATGTDNVITCGSYTTNASGDATVNLGYEPQWFLRKRISGSDNWEILDNMRGWPGISNTSSYLLWPNLYDGENTNTRGFLTATGFTTQLTGQANSTYIYVTIRRGPMKTPTSGTTVYTANTNSDSSGASTTVNFAADMILPWSNDFNNVTFVVSDRLRGYAQTAGSGAPLLATNRTDPETTGYSPIWYNIWNTTALKGNGYSGSGITTSFFGRAPGFFDVVCYTGNDVAGRTVTHNLGVVPELMIVKSRNETNSWMVYSAPVGNTQFLWLQSDTQPLGFANAWNNTTPTSTVFTLGNSSAVNTATSNYVAYLFATCAGVSKVGSYTGTGALQTINCGFTGGARFVLIKRTDSTGDWWYFNSANGISSGNDPYVLLNSTAKTTYGTNYVDTTSVGFQVTAAAPAGLNASGGTYIFLAIA